jgi:hypothetical protein
VPPEELTKFYEAARTGIGELINGVRLVYATERGAMQFLNRDRFREPGEISAGSPAIASGNQRASRPNLPAHVRRQGSSPRPPLDSTLTAPATPKRGGA